MGKQSHQQHLQDHSSSPKQCRIQKTPKCSKLGRPKKVQTQSHNHSISRSNDDSLDNFSITEEQIYEPFSKLFESLKQCRGFVRPQTERKQLIKQSKKVGDVNINWTKRKKLIKQSKKVGDVNINWNIRHSWNEDDQKKKIIQTGERCRLDLSEQKNKYLFNFLYKNSFIHSSQFTSEIYKLIINIYLIIKQRPMIDEKKDQQFVYFDDQRLKKLAQDVYQNYLISFKFKPEQRKTQVMKKADDVPIQVRKQAYLTLVKQIHDNMKKIDFD